MRLELRDITKRFPGVLANDGISISADRGKVLGLLGENGAGKSTLMNILSGLYRPDSGQIFIDGQERVFDNPESAIHAGVGNHDACDAADGEQENEAERPQHRHTRPD